MFIYHLSVFVIGTLQANWWRRLPTVGQTVQPGQSIKLLFQADHIRSQQPRWNMGSIRFEINDCEVLPASSIDRKDIAIKFEPVSLKELRKNGDYYMKKVDVICKIIEEQVGKTHRGKWRKFKVGDTSGFTNYFVCDHQMDFETPDNGVIVIKNVLIDNSGNWMNMKGGNILSPHLVKTYLKQELDIFLDNIEDIVTTSKFERKEYYRIKLKKLQSKLRDVNERGNEFDDAKYGKVVMYGRFVSVLDEKMVYKTKKQDWKELDDAETTDAEDIEIRYRVKLLFEQGLHEEELTIFGKCAENLFNCTASEWIDLDENEQYERINEMLGVQEYSIFLNLSFKTFRNVETLKFNVVHCDVYES